MNPTTKRVGAILAGASVLLTLIWFVALFRPESHALSAAHKAHAAAQQQVAQLDSQVTQLRQLERQIPQDRAALAKMAAAVPGTPSLATVLGQLHSAATASGVTLSSLSPSAPAVPGATGSAQPSTSSVPTITLGMSATGDYHQLMSFLTTLATMPRTVVVDTLSMSGGGSSASLSASITAQIFYSSTATSGTATSGTATS